jgi:hypothetical protein
MSRAPWLAAAVAALGIASCGGGGGGEETSRTDPFTAVEREAERAGGERRAAPRWERVDAFGGRGSAARTVRISDDAIQWRVRWTCSAGDFEMTAAGDGSNDEEIVRGRCAGRRAENLIGQGERRLAVRSTGRWRVVVEQQVETPLHEPPLPAMGASGAELLAQGRFIRIERASRGRAMLHRLPSGRLALRLEGFRTAPNTDLFVWLSRAPRPATSRQAKRAPHEVLAPLKSTLGDQNYLLPRDVQADDFRSIVIWCEPIQIAYTGAPLREAGSSTNSP